MAAARQVAEENLVGPGQIVFGGLLVVVMGGVSSYYIRSQLQALRGLRANMDLAPEERRHLIHQAWRRLINSGLLMLLGLLLLGALVVLEAPAQNLADERAAVENQPNPPELTPEQRQFSRIYGWFWIVFMLVLMVIVFIAALDLWATRRYGLRQHRQLQADRRAMIEEEVLRIRQARNGFH
jgi:hypothetical protein